MKIIKTHIKDELLADSQTENLENILYFLDKYSKLTNKEYYKIICDYYEIMLDDNDYKDYINDKTNNEFTKILTLKTNVIQSFERTKGTGEYSSWLISRIMEKNRLYLKVVSNADLENLDKFFTINEIKELIKQNKIYPLYYYYETCESDLKENKIPNDIEYPIKRLDGKLKLEDEYFNYFMEKIINEVGLNEIFIQIRNRIIKYKIYLEESYYYDEEEKKLSLDNINNVIDCYNETLLILSNNNEEVKTQIISKNKVEVLIEYLKSLPNINSEDWFKDINREQITRILSKINYDTEKELCSEIEQIIIDLGDPQLCYEIVCDVDWIDLDKVVRTIITSKDEFSSYNFLVGFCNQLEDETIQELLQIIIDSEDPEINYEITQLESLHIDVRKHGEAVIKSGSQRYNYLFAFNVPGADIQKHVEVATKNESDANNYSFITNIEGADIDEHFKAIIQKQIEENNLTADKAKTKKLS